MRCLDVIPVLGLLLEVCVDVVQMLPRPGSGYLMGKWVSGQQARRMLMGRS